MKMAKPTIGWLVIGIVVGAIGMTSVPTVKAQPRVEPQTVPTPAGKEYRVVPAIGYMADKKGERTTRLLNEMSQQGFAYVGYAEGLLVFQR